MNITYRNPSHPLATLRRDLINHEGYTYDEADRFCEVLERRGLAQHYQGEKVTTPELVLAEDVEEVVWPAAEALRAAASALEELWDDVEDQGTEVALRRIIKGIDAALDAL